MVGFTMLVPFFNVQSTSRKSPDGCNVLFFLFLKFLYNFTFIFSLPIENRPRGGWKTLGGQIMSKISQEEGDKPFR